MRNRLTLPAIAAAILAAAIAAACGGSSFSDDPRITQFDNELTEEGQQHVGTTVPVPYESYEGGLPPYGGPHDGYTLPCGIYDAPVRVEQAVHSLEHGAVAIWWEPSRTSPEEVEQLYEIARRHLEAGDFTILAPLSGISSKIVLSSWGERMTLDAVEESAIDQYFSTFKHDAPEPVAAGGCVSAL